MKFTLICVVLELNYITSRSLTPLEIGKYNYGVLPFNRRKNTPDLDTDSNLPYIKGGSIEDSVHRLNNVPYVPIGIRKRPDNYAEELLKTPGTTKKSNIDPLASVLRAKIAEKFPDNPHLLSDGRRSFGPTKKLLPKGTSYAPTDDQYEREDSVDYEIPFENARKDEKLDNRKNLLPISPILTNLRNIRVKLLDHLLDYILNVVKHNSTANSDNETMPFEEKLKNYYDPHHFEENGSGSEENEGRYTTGSNLLTTIGIPIKHTDTQSNTASKQEDITEKALSHETTSRTHPDSTLKEGKKAAPLKEKVGSQSTFQYNPTTSNPITPNVNINTTFNISATVDTLSTSEYKSNSYQTTRSNYINTSYNANKTRNANLKEKDEVKTENETKAVTDDGNAKKGGAIEEKDQRVEKHERYSVENSKNIESGNYENAVDLLKSKEGKKVEENNESNDNKIQRRSKDQPSLKEKGENSFVKRNKNLSEENEVMSKHAKLHVEIDLTL